MTQRWAETEYNGNVAIKANKKYLIGVYGGGGFYITLENGLEAYCLLTNCSHLDGGDWNVTTPPHT